MGVTSNWCHPQGHHARRPPTTVPCLDKVWAVYPDHGPAPKPDPNPGHSGPSWCTCGNCREMPTANERICCRLKPQQCVSRRAVSKQLYEQLRANHILLYLLTSNPAWRRNYTHYELWDETTYLFTTAMVAVWEWISNFLPHLIMDVITYPCWN